MNHPKPDNTMCVYTNASDRVLSVLVKEFDIAKNSKLFQDPYHESLVYIGKEF